MQSEQAEAFDCAGRTVVIGTVADTSMLGPRHPGQVLCGVRELEKFLGVQHMSCCFRGT